ncbi:outer membrane protein [Chlorobium limicola]
MKPNIVILLVAGICAIPPLAYAETVPYVGLSAGPGLMHDSGIAYGGEAMSVIVYDAGLALDGAVGLKIDGLRLEAAAGYQTSGFDKQLFLTGSDGDENAEALKIHTAIRSYMVNGYADFDLGGGVVPFVMAGVGLANVDMKYTGTDNWWERSRSEDVFAWQVGAGVGFRIADNVTVDLSYRYFAASDLTIGAFYNDEELRVKEEQLVDMASSKVMLGMQYRFCSPPAHFSGGGTPYVCLSAGLGMMHDMTEVYSVGSEGVFSYDAGMAVEGAVGVKKGGFRLEAAVGYQSSDVDRVFDQFGCVDEFYLSRYHTSTAIRSYMVNGYADFDLGGGVVPFVMAGAGFANVDMKKHWVPSSEWWMDVSYSQDVFAWQVGAGVGFRVADRVMVDLSYRYFTASDIKLAVYDDWDDTLVDIASGKVMFGMRYSL